MIPGDIIPAPGEITLNAGATAVTLMVANTGDRPVQVGSHYHFFEANPAVMSRIRAPTFLRGDGATPAGGGLAWRGVFALGAQGSGFPFHLHGDAYLELLAGAKRWSIYSMAEVGTPPGGYAESLPHSAWLRDVYAREFDGGSKGGHPPPLECVQRPGEIVCKSALLCFESLSRLQCH